MQLTSLIAAAGLAATTTNAFLLPAEISDIDNDIINALPVPAKSEIEVPASTQEQSVKLNCPGCPVRAHHWKGEEGEAKIKTDIPSHLELNFTISHEGASDRLMLNGFELYPVPDLFSQPLTAPLRPDFKHKKGKKDKSKGHHKGNHKGNQKDDKKDGEKDDDKAELRAEHKDKKHHHHKGNHHVEMATLGFGLKTDVVPTTSDDSLELITLDLQIIEVGNAFVDGIPNVEVKLVKLPTGNLAIGNVETTASETIQKTPMDKQEECTTLLCKWRAVIMQQLARLHSHKGCAGKKGQLTGLEDEKAPEDEHRGHGHHAMGHKGHHGHHKGFNGQKHSWGQLFKNIGSHILLPIAVGIMAGVGASILGMLVGTCIVYFWRAFFRPASTKRHHRHGHSAHKAVQQEVAVADEKAGLMADHDGEAPPAYIEEGVVASEEKKAEDEA